MSGQAQRTALYRLYDSKEQLLYIGISDNLRIRYKQHAASKDWWPEVAIRDAEWLPSRDEALAAERSAIKRETPRFNKQRMTKRKKGTRTLRGLKLKMAMVRKRIHSYVFDGMTRGGIPAEKAEAEARRWVRHYSFVVGLGCPDAQEGAPDSEGSGVLLERILRVRGAQELLDEVATFREGSGKARGEE